MEELFYDTHGIFLTYIICIEYLEKLNLALTNYSRKFDIFMSLHIFKRRVKDGNFVPRNMAKGKDQQFFLHAC